MEIEQAFVEDRLLSALHVFPRVRAVHDTTLQSNGETSVPLRQKIMQYAINPQSDNLKELPKGLQPYIHKVVTASHKVTDRDITALKDWGYSEDFVYEITVIAALGSGLQRYQAGISAISDHWEG